MRKIFVCFLHITLVFPPNYHPSQPVNYHPSQPVNYHPSQLVPLPMPVREMSYVVELQSRATGWASLVADVRLGDDASMSSVNPLGTSFYLDYSFIAMKLV